MTIDQRARTFRLGLLALAVLLLSACGRRTADRVVLYSSMDSAVLTPAVRRFEERTGLRVDVVTDTEATKTTGLVNRLIAEKSRPRADVWWSGEVVGTVHLSRAGVLEPWQPPAAHAAVQASGLDRWPIRSSAGDWHGLALRARVLVHRRGQGTPPPASLDLIAQNGTLLAIANPAFGTTRGHLAALYKELGGERLEALLRTLNLKVYDSNSTVVRAVASGEVPLGLTDYDDYLAGLKNGWALDVVFIAAQQAAPAVVASPGSVALVKGGPNPLAARQLVEYILSTENEQALAQSVWGSVPALQRSPGQGQPPFATLDWEAIADDLDASARLWQRARGQ